MHINTEAFRQGQRDRENGWPNLAHLWSYEGWALYAYSQGYDHPRHLQATDAETFYVCWNCGQNARRDQPHACETE